MADAAVAAVTDGKFSTGGKSFGEVDENPKWTKQFATRNFGAGNGLAHRSGRTPNKKKDLPLPWSV